MIQQPPLEYSEYELRLELALACRITARLGLTRGTSGHYSVALPKAGGDLLVTARGLFFEEITAANLVRTPKAGNVSPHEVRTVAKCMHIPIHELGQKAECVLHAHPPNITSFSLLDGMSLPLAHQYNLFLNDRVAYDRKLRGPVTSLEEGKEFASALRDKSVLVLAGHGVVVIGPTIGDALCELSTLESAVGDILRAMATGQPLIHMPDNLTWQFQGPFGARLDARMWMDAWRRKLSREKEMYDGGLCVDLTS